jgi:hypothetical protein
MNSHVLLAIILVFGTAILSAGCSSAGDPPETPMAARLCGGGFGLYLVNQSDVPDVKAVHLSDERIREYSYLKSGLTNPRHIAENYMKKIGNGTVNVTILPVVKFSCDEEAQIYRHNAEIGGRYLEYNGSLYYADYAWIS